MLYLHLQAQCWGPNSSLNALVTSLWIQTRRPRNWCSIERLPCGIPMEKLDPSDLLTSFSENIFARLLGEKRIDAMLLVVPLEL
uniref:Uncharacterized protein n=1 Tax=Arundo donax TaxID=35708 RepID=A0A0A9BT07_ARUDO